MTPEQFLEVAGVLPEPMWLLSATGEITAANAASGRLVGRASRDFVGTPLSAHVAEPPARVTEHLRACARMRALVYGALTFRHADGTAVACRAEGALVQPRTAEGPAIVLLRCKPKPAAARPFVALNEKVQELTRANARLRSAQALLRGERERFEVTLRSIGDAVIATDPQGRVTFMNPVAEALTGWPWEDARGRDLAAVFRIVNETSRAVVESPVALVVRKGTVVGLANHTVLIARDGTERPIDDSGAPIWDARGRLRGVVLVFRDVTERKRGEDAREAALREKEVLLKEVHHRVKNNLQVIASLLSLQSETAQDAAFRALFQESERRIQAMALVHETLYQGSNLGQVHLTTYVQTLIASLVHAYSVEPGLIRVSLAIDEVALPLDTAVPCGLILSELVSNCLKHAFPSGGAGEVSVTVAREADRVRLTVRDSGCGFPEHLDFRQTESLGLQLVCTLTEQLQGTITLARGGGTAFTVTFPLPGCPPGAAPSAEGAPSR